MSKNFSYSCRRNNLNLAHELLEADFWDLKTNL